MTQRLIIGAGIYGLYAAINSAKRGYPTIVLDAEKSPFQRGSYINQARVHNGYHYPRSFSTAAKSAKYYDRFIRDYGDCINADFEQVYAIATHNSKTDSGQFAEFCKKVNIPCHEMTVTDISRYFNPDTVEKAFLTQEVTFDAKLIGEKMYKTALESGVKFVFDTNVTQIGVEDGLYKIKSDSGEVFASPWVLNAAYAGINEINKLAGFELLDVKYELCEVILCSVCDEIRKVGLTVMDGHFFSLMPFGKSGLHSLTSVSKTPHMTSRTLLPTFACQSDNADCFPENMKNCNDCEHRPESAFAEMYKIAKKYLNPKIEAEYAESMYALKPILKASEIDDSRPTLIRNYSTKPYFYSVFSGKINTIYDLEKIL